MKHLHMLIGAMGCVCWMACAGLSLAADVPATQPAISPPAAAATQPAADADPLGDAALTLSEPMGREGGGVRCISPFDSSFWIKAVAPGPLRWTDKASPSLLFYLSKPTDKRVIVTVVERDNKMAPTLLSWSSDGTTAAGMHEISLEKFGKTIDPDKVYRWTVAVRWNESDPSSQFFDAGLIERVSDATKQKLAAYTSAPDAQVRSIYFYDTAAADYDAILAGGDGASAARQSLRNLLDQANLKDAGVDVVHDPELKPPSDGGGQ
jgi:hypothetical protein